MLNVVNRVPRRICVPKRAEEDTYVKYYQMRTASKLPLFVKHYYSKEITKFWAKNVKCTSRNHLGVSGVVANSINPYPANVENMVSS